MTAYQLLREPRHEILRVRGLDMHLTRWGPPPSESESPVFLLHGWLDAGATFQFLVDEFARDRPFVALDWRGFGRSEWPQEGYWFPDYLADLDALLDLLSPGVPASLIGHSMGGNIVSAYSGVRPDRVRCVVNLEGLGLARTSPDQAPMRLRKWLDQLKTTAQRKDYATFDELAAVAYRDIKLVENMAKQTKRTIKIKVRSEMLKNDYARIQAEEAAKRAAGRELVEANRSLCRRRERRRVDRVSVTHRPATAHTSDTMR